MVSLPEDFHPTAQRVADILIAQGVTGPFRQFSESTKSAAEAATALGCDVGQIASSLVFDVDGEVVVVLKSGAFRVDTEKFALLLGSTNVQRATADQVRSTTGQAIGGVSPVGWPTTPRVFIDDALASYDVVWAACGTPNAVFATSFEELKRLTNAKVVSLHV